MKPADLSDDLIREITVRLVTLGVPTPRKLKPKPASTLRTKLFRFMNLGSILVVRKQHQKTLIYTIP